MTKEFKHPDYYPYPAQSAPPQQPSVDGSDYVSNREEIINALIELIDALEKDVITVRLEIDGQALVNTGRDELLNSILGDVWDTGVEVPMAIYEKAKFSENAKHLYMAETALRASRGVSGTYSLDRVDVFNMAIAEAKGLLSWISTPGSVKSEAMIGTVDNLRDALEAVHINGVVLRDHSSLNDEFFAAFRYETDEEKKASGIQKSIHEMVDSLAGIISQHRSNWEQVYSTSKTFYEQKVKQLDTGYPADVAVLGRLIEKRTTLIRDSSNGLFQAINTGDSLKEKWQSKSAISGLTPSDIAHQAYVSHSPSNTGAGATSLENFKPVVITPYSDGGDIFLRKDDSDDAAVIVDMLNQLGETGTLIKAGVIGVRGENQFVNELIAQINVMPEGSTLISGGMIIVRGDRTVDQISEDVTDIGNTLSFFSITDTTLIDGSKIYTGGVLLDSLLAGLSSIGARTSLNLAPDGILNIDLGTSYYLRELRSVNVDGVASSLVWPTNAHHLTYKLQISADNSVWEYLKGGASTWSTMNKQQITTLSEEVITAPTVFLMDGSVARYIRFTFGKFYDDEYLQLVDNLTGNLQVYGASAYIDGASIFGRSLSLGAFPEVVETNINTAITAADNFNNRNDRVSDLPVPACFISVVPDDEQNSDGTVNITIGWDF